MILGDAGTIFQYCYFASHLNWCLNQQSSLLATMLRIVLNFHYATSVVLIYLQYKIIKDLKLDGYNYILFYM